jgi:FkbM family methyltransferase
MSAQQDSPVQPWHEYSIPFWQASSIRLLFGPLRGRLWLPFSRGKLLRLLLGTYEPHQTALFTQQLHSGSVLFDIGAAVGYYTVLSSPLVGQDGCVVAFEPDARNAAFLRRHVAINSLTNVEVHQSAVGNRNGRAGFTCGSGTGTGHLSESGPHAVPICRLDDFVHRSRQPTHIKIDVEGAEMQVLAGARRLLASAKPALFLSTHGPTAHQACCRYLAELDYSIQPMSPDPKYESEVLCTPRRPSRAASLSRIRRAA